MTETETPNNPTQDQRMHEAGAWAAACMGVSNINLEPVSADASFRRYFRFRIESQSIIVMDAPPELEDSRPFVDVSERLRATGLRAPEIFHFDLEKGFGLLEDFGDTLYRDILEPGNANALFPGLFSVLRQFAQTVEVKGLPDYHALKLQQEMELFPEWYLGQHRKRLLKERERQLWNEVCSKLIASACEQPQVFVHRDFHSCNLLPLASGETGIIDFQDAARGPISYDFISLLWDRYISWPREQIERWMEEFHRQLNPDFHLEDWIRWCDLMSVQRNLKVVGIFARLNYRDGKPGYLVMLPRFYSYLLDVLSRYPEFNEFHHLLEQSECAP
jgi:aminoglycoside/choline kinase family phosphotransferase